VAHAGLPVCHPSHRDRRASACTHPPPAATGGLSPRLRVWWLVPERQLHSGPSTWAALRWGESDTCRLYSLRACVASQPLSRGATPRPAACRSASPCGPAFLTRVRCALGTGASPCASGRKVPGNCSTALHCPPAWQPTDAASARPSAAGCSKPAALAARSGHPPAAFAQPAWHGLRVAGNTRMVPAPEPAVAARLAFTRAPCCIASLASSRLN
jgi:hypothetical protein